MANKNYEHYLLEKILSNKVFLQKIENEGYSFFIARNLQGKLGVNNINLKDDEKEFLGLNSYYEHLEHKDNRTFYRNNGLPKTKKSEMLEVNRYAWEDESLLFIGLKHKDDAHSYRRLDITIEECKQHLTAVYEIYANENLSRMMIQYLFEFEPAKLSAFVYEDSKFFNPVSIIKEKVSGSLQFFNFKGLISSGNAGLLGTDFFEDHVKKYNKQYNLQPFNFFKNKSGEQYTDILDVKTSQSIAKDFGSLKFNGMVDILKGVNVDSKVYRGLYTLRTRLEKSYDGNVLVRKDTSVFSTYSDNESIKKKINNDLSLNIKILFSLEDKVVDMNLLSGKNFKYKNKNTMSFLMKNFKYLFNSTEEQILKILDTSKFNVTKKDDAIDYKIRNLSFSEKEKILVNLAQTPNLDMGIIFNLYRVFQSDLSPNSESYSFSALFPNIPSGTEVFPFNKKSMAKICLVSLLKESLGDKISCEKWGNIIKNGIFTEVLEEFKNFEKIEQSKDVDSSLLYSLKTDMLILCRAFGSPELVKNFENHFDNDKTFQRYIEKHENLETYYKSREYKMIGVKIDDLYLESINIERPVSSHQWKGRTLEEVYSRTLALFQAAFAINGEVSKDLPWGESQDMYLEPKYNSGIVSKTESQLMQLPSHLILYVPKSFNMEFVAKTVRHIIYGVIDEFCESGEIKTNIDKIRMFYEILLDREAIEKSFENLLDKKSDTVNKIENHISDDLNSRNFVQELSEENIRDFKI